MLNEKPCQLNDMNVNLVKRKKNHKKQLGEGRSIRIGRISYSPPKISMPSKRKEF